MEVNDYILNKIAAVFSNAPPYCRITFFLNPEAKFIDCTVEKRDRIPITSVLECKEKGLTKNQKPA